MGTKMAPSYANIFMGQFEKKMLASFPHKPLVYFRYIDDIFMIWTEGEDTLNQFFNHCNSLNPSIQFEQTITNTNMPFLDVNIIFENSRLTTDLYSKPTDKHQYFYYSSCHPKHTKTTLPYSLALRLQRICSNETLFQKRIEEMQSHLLQRGYKRGCIKDAIKKATSTSRDDALKESNDPQLINRIPFVVTYNPMLPNLHKIFKDLQPCLSSSERCAEAFPNTPLVSYRRARDLSDMLCSKRLPPSTNRCPTSTTPENDTSPSNNTCPECGLQCKNPKGLKIHRSSKHKKQSNKPTTPGFWPCKSDPRCAICKEGHFSTSITSHQNSKTHNIKQSVTCKSNNVCYLIDCSKCKQQYVGEAELEFHCRMNNHKSDIRLENKSNGMVRHFSKCGIDNVTPNILEKVRSRDHYIRKAREQYYIELLEPQINAQ